MAGAFDEPRLYRRHCLDSNAFTSSGGLVNGIAPSVAHPSTQPAGEPGSAIRVAFSDSGLQDADLAVVIQKLESRLQRGGFAGGAEYAVILDLSCNPGISDRGIQAHVVPFLARWPCCRQLRLCQTSIGDESLRALGTWAASGYAYELHLSNLGGHVTADEVLQFFRVICRSGQYPFRTADGHQAALWLQLAHNRIRYIDDLLARGRSEGFALRVLEQADLETVRPESIAQRYGFRTSAIHLPMFHWQTRKVSLFPGCPHEEGQEQFTLINDRMITTASPSTFISSIAARTAQTSEADVEGEVTIKASLAKLTASRAARIEDKATTKASLARMTSSPTTGTEKTWKPKIEKEKPKAADTPAEVRRPPNQPPQHQHEASTQIQEDVSFFLQGSTIFTQRDFDGRVRQHLHAILTNGGRKRVQEALETVQDSVQDLNRIQIKKPSAYLLKLLRIHLKAMEEVSNI